MSQSKSIVSTTASASAATPPRKHNILKGNLAMGTSKVFSGLNENALRYLLPHHMSAWSGVVFRTGFGAVAFWIMSLINRVRTHKVHHIPTKTKLILLALGFFLMYGYMSFLLLGLTYTTPVVSSIFISIEPVWVFILAAVFFREKVTSMKVIGIVLGLGGALLCILTQDTSHIGPDHNPLLGGMFCLLSSLTYSIYLVVSGKLLQGLDSITVSKWTFTGAAAASVVAIIFTGWYAPVIHDGLFSTPMLVLLYVLVFPTTISYFLLDIGLANLSATVVSLYGYVILIVATVASYILGQDKFDWFQIIAIAMIIASVYFVELAEVRGHNDTVSHPLHKPAGSGSSTTDSDTAGSHKP